MDTHSLYYIKEKWNHNGFQKYLRNTSWVFFARMAILVIAFFVNAYMARYLGPENFGLLNYVFSFVGIFGFLSNLGIESITNREIIKDHSKKNLIIGTGFYLKLFGSFIAILTVFISASLSTNDSILLGLIIMYSFCFIFNSFNIIDIYFQSQVLSKYTAIVTITASLISAVSKIIIIALGFGIIWITAINVLESVIIAGGLLFFFIYKGHSIKEWVFDKTTAILILRDSWPLMLSSVAWSIYMKIDQVMIKNILGNEQTGIYAVAAKLSEFWYFIPVIIGTSVFPAIINAKKISRKLYEKRLSNLYSLIFYISLGIAVLTTIFAYLIIHILFGNEYLEAVTTLRIYVWAGIGVSIGNILYYYLVAENLTKINAVATVIGALINILINIITIPKYGINGAAFASVISYTSVTFVILFFKKIRPQFKIILKAIIFK